MKSAFLCAQLTLIAASLTGCAAKRDTNATPLGTISPEVALKAALSAPQIGRAFEAGTRAADAGDLETLGEKCEELRRLGAPREAKALAGNSAEQAVDVASKLDVMARSSNTRRAELQKIAAQ